MNTLDENVAYGAARQEEKVQFMDVVKEDMQTGGVTERDDRDTVRWRQMIHSAKRR